MVGSDEAVEQEPEGSFDLIHAVLGSATEGEVDLELGEEPAENPRKKLRPSGPEDAQLLTVVQGCLEQALFAEREAALVLTVDIAELATDGGIDGEHVAELSDVRELGADHRPYLVTGILVLGQRDAHLGEDRLLFALQTGVDELWFTAGEVMVDRCLPDPESVRDVAKRGLSKPMSSENPQRLFEDRLSVEIVCHTNSLNVL